MYAQDMRITTEIVPIDQVDTHASVHAQACTCTHKNDFIHILEFVIGKNMWKASHKHPTCVKNMSNKY